MHTAHVNAMKAHVGFDERDAVRVNGAADVMESRMASVVERFYKRLLQDPEARGVFSGGQPQIDRQRRLLAEWLRNLFGGTYDAAYFERIVAIGNSHVRSGVPQHFMVTAIEVIRQELERELGDAAAAGHRETNESINKLLTLELAVMLEGYKERYSELIRRSERTAVEEKLTRAEHLAEIGQLAASLAHEIKNPLAGISGAMQIMRDEMPSDDSKQSIVSEILAQISRLDATVNDLLHYARPTPPRLGAVSLNQIVDRVLKFLQGEPAMRRVSVRCERPTGDAVIEADDGQIEQLLINLILNAAQASQDGDNIHIGVHRDGDSVRLVVRDEGCGMNREIRNHAFEPFYTTKARGTGLGLSICRRIVEVHGGTIQVDSELGVGTTVKVDLLCRPD